MFPECSEKRTFPRITCAPAFELFTAYDPPPWLEIKVEAKQARMLFMVFNSRTDDKGVKKRLHSNTFQDTNRTTSLADLLQLPPTRFENYLELGLRAFSRIGHGEHLSSSRKTGCKCSCELLGGEDCHCLDQ